MARRLGDSLLRAAAAGTLALLWGCCAADWRPEKLTTCNLVHPLIEEGIRNATSIFAAKGIREEVVRSLHDPCIGETTKHACIKSQRILIKDGVVYVTNLMPPNGFGYVELIGFLVELYETSQIYKLPDVEFAYWHDDNPPAEATLRPTPESPTASAWPFAPHELPPIFAWATFPGNGAMVVPYCGAFRCPADSFDVLLEQVSEFAKTSWEQRERVAFGRWNIFCAWYYGAHTRTQDGNPIPCPRQYVSEQLYPNNTDKLLTAALQQMTPHGPAKSVPLSEQYKYRYIVSTDGWSISSKFDKYLLLGSTVLKAEGFVTGWYYPAIRPYEHYVPFMVKHKNDLLEVVDWVRQNDGEAHRIAGNAQTFAMRNLNRAARTCYLFKLITELAKHMRYTVDCAARPVCVPLVEEIKFLAKADATRRNCKYEEVLAHYGRDDPAAKPGDSGYDALLKQHEAVPKHVWGGRRQRRQRQ